MASRPLTPERKVVRPGGVGCGPEVQPRGEWPAPAQRAASAPRAFPPRSVEQCPWFPFPRSPAQGSKPATPQWRIRDFCWRGTPSKCTFLTGRCPPGAWRSVTLLCHRVMRSDSWCTAPGSGPNQNGRLDETPGGPSVVWSRLLVEQKSVTRLGPPSVAAGHGLSAVSAVPCSKATGRRAA